MSGLLTAFLAATRPVAGAATAPAPSDGHVGPGLLAPGGGPKVSYYVPGGGPRGECSSRGSGAGAGSTSGGSSGGVGSTTIAERRAARATAALAAAAASEATAAGLWACRAPHFHHEFVFQLLMRAANSLSSDRTAAHGWVNRSPVAGALLGLLATVVASGLVSSTQLRLGGLRADERATAVAPAATRSTSSSSGHSGSSSSDGAASPTTADARRLDRLRTLARELYSLEW